MIDGYNKEVMTELRPCSRFIFGEPQKIFFYLVLDGDGLTGNCFSLG
jgi:hypothetical protein